MLSIVICRQSGDKWQSKTISNKFFSTFVDNIMFSIAAYPVTVYVHVLTALSSNKDTGGSHTQNIDEDEDSDQTNDLSPLMRVPGVFYRVRTLDGVWGKAQLYGHVYVAYSWVRPFIWGAPHVWGQG